MSDKYVWVIGGGLMQLPLARAARARGFKVIVSDRDPHCACWAAADKFWQIDTYNMEKHLDYAREHAQMPIAAVLADAIDVGHVSAAVADYLGLPSLTYTVARNLGNKAELARTLHGGHPVRMIIKRELWPAEAWSNWFKRCNNEGIKCLPCVIKPVDNCASRGVTRVDDLAQFGDAITLARQANHDDSRVLIEEFITGEEFSSDWFVTKDKRVIQTNGARRIFDPEYPTIEIAYTNPYVAPEPAQQAAAALVERVGMKYGPLKIDFILSPIYGPCIIEAAGRWSGSFDHTHARQLSCGNNLVGELLNWGLGEAVDEDALAIPTEHEWACTKAPLFEPGRITGWRGLDIAREILGEYSYIIDRQLSTIPAPISSGARPLFIIARADTEDGAFIKAERAANEIAPIYL